MTPAFDPISAAARGAAGGAVATGVMSAVMLGAERLGLMGRHPPERIVERGLAAVGAEQERTRVDAAAGGAHLVFGTACGALFGLIARVVRPRAPEALGVPFAVGVWIVSYFGWIPALRILPPPSEDRPGRAWTMLAAHLVYGVALGAAWRVLARR